MNRSRVSDSAEYPAPLGAKVFFQPIRSGKRYKGKTGPRVSLRRNSRSARAPVTNVASIESDLPWEELEAIPESYATAWTCLFRNLELVKGQEPVIRGGMSLFGQATLNMSVNAGAEVSA